MNRVALLWCLAVLKFSGPAEVCAAEIPVAETMTITEASQRVRAEDWQGAAEQWERAMLMADSGGAYDRAIAHGERSLATWRKLQTSESLEHQAFVLQVMSKLDLNQGRLSQSHSRNLEALDLILGRIAEISGWHAIPGQPVPAMVPTPLVEAWAQAHCNAANWLDAQGRTVEAVALLTAVDDSVKDLPASNDGGTFYCRKVVSIRASLRKFLGFEEQGIADLRRLVNSARANTVAMEAAQRFNLAYFQSQFYGPKPEYLDAARKILTEFQVRGRTDRGVRRLIAKMAYAYREEGADVSDLESVIAEARAEGAQLEAIYALRDFAVLTQKSGHPEAVEKALLDSLEGFRQRGIKRAEPSLYRDYGEFLLQNGRAAESLQMLREALRLTRAFGWMQHLPSLLKNVAEAQAALGDIVGLRQTLAELDALVAAGGLTPQREFFARCARAKILLLLARPAEAEAALTEARALADRAGLNEYQRRSLRWAEGVSPAIPVQAAVAGAQAPAGHVDLQPIAVLATAESGATALARFRLSNPAAQAAEGTLEITGRKVTARLDESGSIATVVAGREEGADRAQLPLRVGPGEEVLIKIEAGLPEGSGAIRLQWQSGDASARAVCEIHSSNAQGEDEPGATVSNTSLASDNPFYAVPLHHPVRASGEATSLRIVPSQPCRVELLDTRTGAILAVDADGDGAFRSAGDSLAGDGNGDGFPDLPIDSKTGLGEIEILVFPLGSAAPSTRDTRLEVQVKTATGWKTVAHDILKAPDRLGGKLRN